MTVNIIEKLEINNSRNLIKAYVRTHTRTQVRTHHHTSYYIYIYIYIYIYKKLHREEEVGFVGKFCWED